MLKMFACICLALTIPSSNAFGVIILHKITPQSVAEHKGAFDVQTTVHKGSIEFRITRLLDKESVSDKESVWFGYIEIQKDGRKIFTSRLLPTEDKSRVCYVFTIATEYISDSNFNLSKGRWGDLTIGSDDKKVTTKEIFTDERYHFSLRDFVDSADAPK